MNACFRLPILALDVQLNPVELDEQEFPCGRPIDFSGSETAGAKMEFSLNSRLDTSPFPKPVTLP